ncbi:MAG: single-stranded-DNA-specific exonuclease RecJ, partial [Clostridia bacterium]|nr:single-stranded-DNA-specific exonuclease RecJ [Clostridia bacterium]
MSIYQRSKPVSENTKSVAALLQIGLGISELTAALLVNRGVTGLKEGQAFLNPSLDQLHDPFLLKGMGKAVNRIRHAIAIQEKIFIYGDYDADGITSSSMLSLYLRSQGGNVDVYIPSRQEEGYGIHKDALETILEQGSRLVITVDCGISAIEEVGEMQGKMDIIITDHHTPGQILPPAYAVINPKIPRQAYPFDELAGVGVAAKLVQALGGLDTLKPYLDLVAIGTVADIVPLMDENRVFAALGIRQLNENPRPGISALLQALEMKDKTIDAGKISYSIAPCLNAPGRMTSFRPGYELLTAENIQQALPQAEELVCQNQLRRQTESTILESAMKMVEQQVDLTSQRVIVVSGEEWHPGVIGIVASRITEEYCRPSIILSLDGEKAVGSARSIKGFHLYEALSSCSDLLLRFGGHEMAAGLSLSRDNIDSFRQQICSYADEVLDEEALVPHYYYDEKLPQEQVSLNLLNEIEQLAPFGCGNPAPRFLLPSALVESSRLIGSESNHIKMALSLGQRSWDAIGFGLAEAGRDFQQGCRISLMTSLKRNEWMGVSSAQFQIYSMKRIFSEPEDLNNLLSIFYFKVFDVFLQEFMYNDNIIQDMVKEKPSLRDKSVNGQAVLTLEDTINYLKDSLIGTVVFVSTYEEAVLLLNRLMEENLLESIPVQYHQPYWGNGPSRNSVVLVPDYKQSPEKYYRTVITPGKEESFHSNLPVSLSNGHKRKHYQAWSDETMKDKKFSAQGFDLDRNQL